MVLETKGGALADSYENFIITSQYSLDECFGYEAKTLEAMKRRFRVIHMDGL